MPTHHPTLDLLMDYATGALGEAGALIIATHLALCPNCRRQVREYEMLGGLFLDQEDLTPLADECLQAVMARLDQETGPPGQASHPGRATGRPAAVLPQPLRGYLGGDPSDLTWKTVARGMETVGIEIGAGTARARLMRLRPGTVVPRHTHDGTELMLVLAGGVADRGVDFRRGDLSISDASVDHSPAADPREGCICLMVTDAPLRLTGTIGRLLNPFVRL
ncbi:MAG TPA: ChrR family anti-sigma-E factor [Azospirillaceae bacterium]|nr:ChrR family anti-sigma-E factor [Azospirillaceae bacterium]